MAITKKPSRNGRSNPVSSKKFSPTNLKSLRAVNFGLLFSVVGVFYLIFTSAASIAGYYGSIEKDQVNRINGTRSANGRGSLQHIECLNTVAEEWTKKMVDIGRISHNPYLANEVSKVCGNSWSVLGENVGVGYDSPQLFNAFMASPSHKANILDGRFTKVGVGAYYKSDGRLFITQVFAKCSSCTSNWNQNALLPEDPKSAPAPTELTHLLRNSNSAGSAEINFKYGVSTYRHLYCDWDGNGTDTVGVYDNGNWYIRNSNSAGSPELTVSFGYAAAKPVCGDWDGNGTDTIGIYDAGNWSMRNTNTPGSPEIAFAYGYSAALPVVGDWNGDGRDTVGVYDAGNWMMRNSNSPGNPEISFAYGYSAAKPVAGDWNGDGRDTVGVYDAGNWMMRNSNSPGNPEISFAYGASNYMPIVGDWNGDRVTTIGVVTK